jgi:hypothetical protein
MSDYFTHPSSHPDWSGDPDPDPPPSPRLAYRCLACNWTGSGGLSAFEHHLTSGHHQIGLRDAPAYGPVWFTCCAPFAKREDR